MASRSDQQKVFHIFSYLFISWIGVTDESLGVKPRELTLPHTTDQDGIGGGDLGASCSLDFADDGLHTGKE